MKITAKQFAAAEVAPSPLPALDPPVTSREARHRKAPSAPGGWLLLFFATWLLLARTAESETFSALHQFDTSPNDIGIGRQGPSQACDASGNIYGTTYAGGAHGNGTIYRLSTDGAYKTLYSFTATSGGTNSDGSNPVGGLVAGPDGNFYGTTYAGGSNGNGAVFQITPGGGFNPLYSFSALDGDGDNGDGANPAAALIVGPDEALYGTAYYGGASGAGSIFRITTSGSLNLIYSFKDDSDGANPATALVVGHGGAFYGTAQSGEFSAGTAFRMIVSNGTLAAFNLVHSFSGGANDGINPSSLTLGPDNNLYGTSSAGGADDQGTVFQMTPDAPAAVSVIYSFQNPNPGTDNNSGGYQPFAPLILAPDGNLYGVANVGGNAGVGEIFEISTAGVFTPLFSLQSKKGGIGPVAPLVLAPNGDFYGTTSSGGASFQGTLFRLSLASNTEFSVQAGTYAGLSGSNFLTLTLSASGHFSGKFFLSSSGESHSFTGAFNPFGQYTGSTGKPSIPISLSLGVSDNSGTLGSYVAGGMIGTASITAYHAAYARGQQPNEIGKYTVLLNPTGLGTSIPAGPGYAQLAVSGTGGVSMTGKLANGTAFSCGGVVVGGGADDSDRFIVFADTAAEQLIGAFGFVAGANSDFSGNLAWNVAQSKKSYYGAGFTTTLSGEGIHYLPPGRGVMALGFPGGADNGEVILSNGGNISAVSGDIVVENVTLSAQNKIADNGPNYASKIKLTINAASGTFTGSFVDTNTHKAITYGGVLYQNPNNPQADGFFLGPVDAGTGLSGVVQLQSQ